MNILELPLEIIYYISEFLPFRDRYHFSKTNSVLYHNIWIPLDIASLFDLLIYSTEINFYSTLFSDNVKDWINHSFVFYLSNNGENDQFTLRYYNGENDQFTLGYYYHEPKLYLKIHKTFDMKKDMSLQQIEKIKQIEMIGFNHQYIVGENTIYSIDKSFQMEFSKKIGYISEGYEFLFDEIHKNIQMILQFYQAEPFFPIFIDTGDSDVNYVDIIYKDLCQLSLDKNKNYSKEDICSTYYFYVWCKRWGCYNYKDYINLKIANEKKQKILSEKIHQTLHKLRLTTNNEEPKDKNTLKKIAYYKSRKHFI
jgi:hypothetical protein